MRDYELVMILNPNVPDEEVPGTVEKVTRVVTEKGGTLTEVKPWGRRRLAYPIQHQREGVYVLAYLKMEPKVATQLENQIRVTEEVMRHLLVYAEK
ncbi:MAG: 30S ribosomal protein S6 [Chloroflexi bacterium]|nr:30S ribosomal protein S6 [Chloroflexota bacterium]